MKTIKNLQAITQKQKKQVVYKKKSIALTSKKQIKTNNKKKRFGSMMEVKPTKNYMELEGLDQMVRQRIKAKGTSPKSDSDVEQLLQNYHRFKIYWKQIAVKKFLEEYLGIKINRMKNFKPLAISSHKNGNLLFTS